MSELKSRLLSRLGTLGPVIQELCTATGAPSAALGIALDGETIHEAHFGFRDVASQLPPDSDTIYGIGSITKGFTASAIGILVDEGLLKWETPLREVLPEFHHEDQSVERGLTISDLLAHKSGLATSNNWWYGADGTLLLSKNQTIRAFSALKSLGPLRTRYDYSNWNYAVLGEIIERKSGLSYGTYIHEKILQPLGMARTSVTRVSEKEDDNIALPYAVLDDHSSYQLPLPRSEDGQVMMSAQAIRSTVNDLLKYMTALNRAYHSQLASGESSTPGNPLRNVVKQLTGHNPRGSGSMLQKEYCFGFHRHQLPNKFDGLGCNTMFVRQMPTIVPGNEGGLVLSHGGSLAGYTSFISLLPQINCSVAVLVNSIGLGDPAGWINHLLIEAVTETPSPHDYLSLAKEAGQGHISRVTDIRENFQKARNDTPLSRPLEDYVGTYQDRNQEYHVDVRIKQQNSPQLEISFQGLESQTWTLTHYDGDSFLLPLSFNELAKRAMFTFVGKPFFLFTFKNVSPTEPIRLYWAQDAAVPAEEQFFVKSSNTIHSSKRTLKDSKLWPVKCALL